MPLSGGASKKRSVIVDIPFPIREILVSLRTEQDPQGHSGQTSVLSGASGFSTDGRDRSQDVTAGVSSAHTLVPRVYSENLFHRVTQR